MVDVRRRVLIVRDFDLTDTEETQLIPVFARFLPEIKAVYKTYRPTKVEFDGRDSRPVYGEAREVSGPDDYFRVIEDVQWRAARGLGFMQQMLWDKDRVFQGRLSRELFADAGRGLKMAPGIPDGLWWMKEYWRRRDVDVHFVTTSVGIREIIEASALNDVRDGEHLIDRIFSGEFHYDEKGRVDGFVSCPSPFDKTQGIIESVKGNPLLLDDRRAHSQNMFDYQNVFKIGDGFTDVSAFAFVGSRGGVPVAVYKEGDPVAFERAMSELRSRVKLILPRDYRPESETTYRLNQEIERMASRTCDFSPGLLDDYRNQRIDAETRAFVRAHVATCKDCRQEDVYSLLWVPPR